MTLISERGTVPSDADARTIDKLKSLKMRDNTKRD